MTGTLAQYDDLCEALEAYEATSPNDPRRSDRYWSLRHAAVRCGCGDDEPAVPFAKRRVATYRATVTGAVAHLNAVITSLEIAQ